jgi:hypothetical protein
MFEFRIRLIHHLGAVAMCPFNVQINEYLLTIVVPANAALVWTILQMRLDVHISARECEEEGGTNELCPMMKTGWVSRRTEGGQKDMVLTDFANRPTLCTECTECSDSRPRRYGVIVLAPSNVSLHRILSTCLYKYAPFQVLVNYTHTHTQTHLHGAIDGVHGRFSDCSDLTRLCNSTGAVPTSIDTDTCCCC